jgi:hypothetical protein
MPEIGLAIGVEKQFYIGMEREWVHDNIENR